MRLALIGHGAMGQLVERLAREAGDVVATVLGAREAASCVRAEREWAAEADSGKLECLCSAGRRARTSSLRPRSAA